jgi:hypothetical protein
MATRSLIGIRLPSGNLRGIYCHFDGYPTGVGETLKEHYTEGNRVEQLLKLGDISFLGESLGKTVAYHRDRGENLTPNWQTSATRLEDEMKRHGADYAYIFEGGNWEVIKA